MKMTTNNYQKGKEKLRKEACEKYQNLSEKEKDKRQKKARERYLKKKKAKNSSKNLSEENEKKLAEFSRNYYSTHKK